MTTLRSEAPQPFQYQGSKRAFARHILTYVPDTTTHLIEPFAGSAAVTLAAAHYRAAETFHINDVNAPLMGLWRAIVEDPESLGTAYGKLWHAQQDDPRAFFKEVRDRFNAEPGADPADFLYLLSRIVKGAVRYNSQGEFNQGADNRRLGTKPERMSLRLREVSGLLAGRVTITATDYREVLTDLPHGTLVYMDPPYQGVSGTRDARYASGLPREDFEVELARLVDNGAWFILSYDGRTGDKTYGDPLPEALGLLRTEVAVGRSSSATLLGRDDVTTEALYLSPALVERLPAHAIEAHYSRSPEPAEQLALAVVGAEGGSEGTDEARPA